MSQTPLKPLSILDLTAMKQRGEKIACLTAYDASFAALIDRVGIDMILVGDSLAMTMQGHSTTLSATIDDMVYHSRCVSQSRQRAFVVADLPFMTYHTQQLAAENAAKLLRRGGVQMVKLEGARLDIIHHLVNYGVPVCGHLGLLPQAINQLGHYSVQGRSPDAAENMLTDALNLQAAGASLLVLECVPADLAKAITAQLQIPVIGIGAGVDCDGQVLVLQDMLNITAGKPPRFVKDFMHGAISIEAAIAAYQQSVKSGEFPTAEHSF